VQHEQHEIVFAWLGPLDPMWGIRVHDSGGWVCLGAMAAGKTVTCLDLGGSAELVTNLTGIKVVANNPENSASPSLV
jgi:hypothetical protein